MIPVHEFEDFPNGFFECPPEELYKLFPGPSLIFLKGATEPPLFVSTIFVVSMKVGHISDATVSRCGKSIVPR